MPVGEPTGEAVGVTTRKRQANANATRAQLLEAARRVFEEKGYQGTTVGAITSAADTAHGTFYLYFRNKEDAFAKVVGAVTTELYEQAERPWREGDPYEAIEISMRGFLEVFVAHRGLWRCVLEGSFTSPTLEAMWLGIRRQFIERIEANLRELKEAGQIRPLDPAVTAHALGSMVEWTATTRFVLDAGASGDVSIDDMVRTLTDLWYHAVYTDAARPGPPETP
jgi:AcrR family transcriptional regulator